MGIKMIDFGSVEVQERSNSVLAESDKSGWLAEPVSFKFSVAKTGTRQIEMKFKITDEDAVDVDGGSFTGLHVWDRLYFTDKSAKMTKLKLRGLGYPVNELVISDDDDLKDLAEELLEQYTEEVRVVTEVEEDGERSRARVKFINGVK